MRLQFMKLVCHRIAIVEPHLDHVDSHNSCNSLRPFRIRRDFEGTGKYLRFAEN